MLRTVWSYLLLVFDLTLWFVVGFELVRAWLIYITAGKLWEMEMLSRVKANLPVSDDDINAHPSPKFIPAFLVGLLASSIEYSLKSRFNKWFLLSSALGAIILGGALQYHHDKRIGLPR